jgi:hypothetical protein
MRQQPSLRDPDAAFPAIGIGLIKQAKLGNYF